MSSEGPQRRKSKTGLIAGITVGALALGLVGTWAVISSQTPDYSNLKRLELTLTYPDIYPEGYGAVLTSQYAQVGVKLTPKQVPFASWLEDVYTNKQFDLSIVNHAESRDFWNYVRDDYYFGYNNPEVTRLYNESLISTPEQAAQLLSQAAKIVADEAGAEWLMEGHTITALAEGVAGFPLDGTANRVNLTKTSYSKSEKLRVGLVLEPGTLDIRAGSGAAIGQILIDNVYEGLVRRTADGTAVEPLLADYTVSEDGLSYSFTLKGGAKFHSGNALTVDDVVWSLQSVKDNPSYNGNREFQNVASITKTGENSLELKLNQPDSNFLWLLSAEAGLVHEKAFTKSLNSAANGTGPFKFQSWRQQDSITLVQNSDYWGEAAPLKELEFVYFADANAALNAVKAGEVEVQTGVVAALKPEFEKVAGFKIEVGKTTEVWTLAFNQKKAPLDDIKVRQALRQAINREALLAALGNPGIPLGSPIPQLDPGYTDLTSIDAYNPENAKKLLAEAGYNPSPLQ